MLTNPLVRQLVWDEWNRSHLTKHDVLPDEAEEVVFGEPIARQTYKARWQVIGRSTDGRMLTVILGEDPHQPGQFYIFSARPASRLERRYFEEQMEESQP